MKSRLFVLSLLALTATPLAMAQTEKPVLTCSTNGYGLASMEVVETSPGKGLVKIIYSEDGESPADVYEIQSGLKDLRAGTSATVIAQKAGASASGGTFEQAVLLRVLDGQKSARLAVGGNVHLLYCL